MARVTTEDCLAHVDNMYELVIVAAQRARQLYKGSSPLVDCKNRELVTALREIGEGHVTPRAFQEAEDGDEFTFMPN